jgi:hypothetical protein
MALNDLSHNEIITRDPLLRWLCIRLNWSNTRIIVMASLVAAVFFFVPGGIASASYQAAKTTDGIAGDYKLFSLWILIFSPGCWGLYLWQARIFTQILLQPYEKGVFGKTNSKVQKANAEKIRAVFHNTAHPALLGLALVAVAGFWSLRFYFQSGLFQTVGKYWYEVKWDLPFYVLGWSLALFVLYTAILRQFVFIANFWALFRKAELEINPLDPDEVGGLGAVSQFISAMLMFVIGFGFLISIFMFISYQRGINLFARGDTLSTLVLYLILAPFAMLASTLPVRGAMLRARSKILAPIAEEFRKLMERASAVDEGLKGQNEHLQVLQERYRIIMDTYPVVPLSKSLLRIFGFLASIPYLSVLTPFVKTAVENTLSALFKLPTK